MMHNLKSSETALLAMVGSVVALVLITALAVVVPQYHTEAAQARGREIATGLEYQGFREIEAVGKWRVELSRGDDWEVGVSYPEAYADFVRLDLQGDRLTLEFDPPIWRDGPDFPVTARIVMPELELLESKGYGEITMHGFEGRQLEVDIRGKTSIEGHGGRYGALRLSATGMSTVDLSGIIVRDADVHVRGNARVTLSMDGGTLSGRLAGAGTLNYSGPVSEESVRISGVARVKRLD